MSTSEIAAIPATDEAPTRRIAAWLAGLRPEHLPARSREAIRLALFDTLAAGRHGRERAWSGAVRDWLDDYPPAPGTHRLATLWGEARRDRRPADAAMANAVAAHAFELDDFHNAKLHPGAVVIPAALALAEAHDAPGALLETAIAAGYEVMIRTGLALDPSVARLRGWHLTGVCGPLGAAAAGAVLLGLDGERCAWALGLAGTQGAGLFAFNADGTMSKRLHPGFAARAGVTAVQLAARGVSGPTQLYEAADGGFLAAFSDVTHADALTAGLGWAWRLDDTAFKPYSCCGSLHAYIDAALQLRRELGGPPAAELAVTAGLAKVVEVQCGYDYTPGTELNAQMSARYCIAAALADGQVLPPQFTPEKLADPDLLRRARAMRLVHDAALDEVYPANFCGWVEIEAAGGPRRIHVHDPSGAATNPERATALRAKARGLLAELLPAAAIDALEVAISRLEDHRAGDLVAPLAQTAA